MGKFMSKIPNFDGLGAVPHISAPINVKFLTRGANRGSCPLPHAKFHVYRCNMSLLQGEKPILDR